MFFFFFFFFFYSHFKEECGVYQTYLGFFVIFGKFTPDVPVPEQLYLLESQI